MLRGLVKILIRTAERGFVAATIKQNIDNKTILIRKSSLGNHRRLR